MTTPRSRPSPLRRALPWVVGFMAVRIALGIAGRVLARQLDTGDETSSDIRRVATFGQLRLAPVTPALSRMEVDLVFAGAEIDLTGAQPQPGGADLTLKAAFGGGNVHVPPHWRVAWDSRGVGGVGVGKGESLERTVDPATADLRVHVRALFGGVGLTTAPT